MLEEVGGGAERERGTGEMGGTTEAVRCSEVSPGPGLKRPGVLSHICHLLTLGPPESHVSVLSLSFPISKMGAIPTPQLP